MATYAIGDIQGCFGALKKLLTKIEFDPQIDELWLAGDLINRGPDSLDTLRFAYSLGDSVRVVLGNHDLHLLAAYFGCKKLGSKDSAREILNAPDCDELIQWLIHRPLAHYCSKRDLLMVHAGIPPVWNVNQALELGQEVEKELRSSNPQKFFQHMYGNQPDIWSDSLQGHDRRRLITNYFTRMRFCTADGKLELTSKGGPADAPKGFSPWFTHPHQMGVTRVVFGHWAALLGETKQKQFIGLDTGCVWGGCLTAWHIERDFYIQQNCYSEGVNSLL